MSAHCAANPHVAASSGWLNLTARGRPATPLAGLTMRRMSIAADPELSMTRDSASYEIRVRGHLGLTMRTAFPDLRARLDGDDTVLSGALPDQAAVYGVLAVIEDLGLELIEVRRVAG